MAWYKRRTRSARPSPSSPDRRACSAAPTRTSSSSAFVWAAANESCINPFRSCSFASTLAPGGVGGIGGGLEQSLEQTQRGAGAAAYVTASATESNPNPFANHNWTAGPGNPLGAPANDNGMPVYGDQTGGMENQSVIAGYGYAAWQKACHQ